ncbi:MAG: hypothetical protein WBM75_00355 [Polyangiales bacterium]|jgi:hypothetical protein
MTKNKLTILCVTLLSVFAVACGEAGTANVDKDPGLDGQAGAGGVGESEAATGGPIDCNDGFSDITIRNDRVQAVRIYVQGVPETQTLIEYTLTVDPFLF